MLVCEASGETLLSELFVKMSSSDVTVLRWSNSWSVISCEMWDRKINVVPDPLIFEGFLNIKVVNAIRSEERRVGKECSS